MDKEKYSHYLKGNSELFIFNYQYLYLDEVPNFLTENGMQCCF